MITSDNADKHCSIGNKPIGNKPIGNKPIGNKNNKAAEFQRLCCVW